MNICGNLTKVTPSSRLTKYFYPHDNRLLRIDYNEKHWRSGNPCSLSLAGPYKIQNTDVPMRLERRVQMSAKRFASQSEDVGLICADNRASVTGIGGNYQYTYDGLDQLVGTTGTAVHNYSYDAAGNRTVVDGSTYTTNNLNQYTSGGGSSYAYNANGNMATKGSWTYGYDEENRLVSANKSGTAAAYVYDGLGRRIKKTVNGTVTKYIYDGDRVIAEYNNTGTLKAEYIYGIGIDEVVTMDRAGTRYNYVYDGLGSVAKLVNNAGVNVETYTYNPYGVPTAISTVGNPYLFTGREYDNETSLYNYRARIYNAAIGRFLQRDPIGFVDDANLYKYVKNSPTNLVDPYGLFSWWDITDIYFFLESAQKFKQCPGGGTGRDLALDTVSLLPIIPSVGLFTRAYKSFDAIQDANKTIFKQTAKSLLKETITWIKAQIRVSSDIFPCQCSEIGIE